MNAAQLDLIPLPRKHTFKGRKRNATRYPKWQGKLSCDPKREISEVTLTREIEDKQQETVQNWNCTAITTQPDPNVCSSGRRKKKKKEKKTYGGTVATNRPSAHRNHTAGRTSSCFSDQRHRRTERAEISQLNQSEMCLFSKCTLSCRCLNKPQQCVYSRH